MGIAIEIALVLLLIGVALSWIMRGRKQAELAEMTERRVAAYIETIRREKSQPDLVAMSDTELRDLLLSSAHNLKVLRDRRMYLLFGGVLVALIGAIMVGAEDGTRGFGIALVIAAVVLYGVNEWLGRQMVAPLMAKGIDTERLRVE